ncbi:MAG: phosphopantothenoylcysteine decarboxylase [Planctomycetes bacterium]|nr:phosphopantothenoylcysteine decarboxylase [Planctomycetota bacterium]
MAKKLTTRVGDLRGLQVLITAGPTWEYLDEVRFLSNPSTGLMGMELARACQKLGGNVTVVCGPTHLQAPPGIALVPVVSAQEMLEAVTERFDHCNVFIASAAVSDYRPARREQGKVKKGAEKMVIEFVLNPDVLKAMGARRRDDQIVIGFSLETANEIENARRKLQEKNCDLMVVNTPQHFGQAKEFVRIISARGLVAELPPSTKTKVAEAVVDLVAKLNVSARLPVVKPFDTKGKK